jgi:hypothetical protein
MRTQVGVDEFGAAFAALLAREVLVSNDDHTRLCGHALSAVGAIHNQRLASLRQPAKRLATQLADSNSTAAEAIKENLKSHNWKRSRKMKSPRLKV